MNTINLISAISVLACNTSLATIPKQANNTSDYGDIVVIDREVTYTQSNSLTSHYGVGNTAKDYSVYRELGSYSDDRINFYSERYYFESSWNSEGDVISLGYVTFFTVAIYDNTLLSSFIVKDNFKTTSGNPINVSGTIHSRTYNQPLNITNLGNTLYFSNYNLAWHEDSDVPLVAYCSDSYLPYSEDTSTVSGDIQSLLYWGQYSNNFDRQHGSINFCLTQYITLDSVLNISQVGIVPRGLSLTYKYYINNPTYEVIDLPNVMLSILTMPFTFFSQAFNLTLFPNTPYALNVGHTILIIVGVIGTIYLIKYLVGIFKG